MRSTFFDETRTRERLAEFIKTAPRLSMGEECASFEVAFAAYQGRRHAVLVGNGSLANLGLIQALLNLGRLKKGDRVGVSAVTWATNVMPLLQLGLIPVSIDCEVGHLNVSSLTLREHLDGLQALFITNALGFCGDLEVIAALCEERGVILLEDNCESLGTRYKGKLLGNYGLASTSSFFVGHHLSTIEGGMIATDDEELAHMLIMVRAHGWDRNLPAHRQAELRGAHDVDDFHAQYTFYESAYNLRPTEITGFLGTVQLPMLEEMIDRRIRNFKLFLASARTREDLYYPMTCSHIERISNFAMPIVCRSPEMIDAARIRFAAAGIEVRPVIAGNIAVHPFWTKALPPARCPGAELIHAQGFYFPNNPDLTDQEVELLCSLLAND
jgi:CDP-6-deoxy-D-xylo-4-hexulose-3-dehydrase